MINILQGMSRIAIGTLLFFACHSIAVETIASKPVDSGILREATLVAENLATPAY
jgi:hypothetical protein